MSDKVDVFSFGVLALEVVSGRKNISFDVPPDKAYLTDWVRISSIEAFDGCGNHHLDFECNFNMRPHLSDGHLT